MTPQEPKESIEEQILKDYCGCFPAYKDRGMVDPGCFGHRVIESGILSQAISTAIAQRKKELKENVEEMLFDPAEEYEKTMPLMERSGWNKAVKAVLSLL